MTRMKGAGKQNWEEEDVPSLSDASESEMSGIGNESDSIWDEDTASWNGEMEEEVDRATERRRNMRVCTGEEEEPREHWSMDSEEDVEFEERVDKRAIKAKQYFV